MELSRQTKRHLMQLIAFGIILYCGLEHLDVVLGVLGAIWSILLPFVLGGAIAFIINVPMRAIEKHLFPKNKKLAKLRRPVAYLLTLLCVIGVFALALVVVIPELGNTITLLVEQIPVAFEQMQKWMGSLGDQWPALEPFVSEMNVDWQSLSQTAVNLVQGIATGLLNSGVGLFSGIVSAVTTFVIGFIFSIYVLFQKEKLLGQTKQILYAFLPEKVTEKILSVGTLSHQVFSNFLSGQCLEAVILGTLFVISMTILRMPYAMLTGIVIALTALVPLVGAFIVCAVGMLLIVMVNPIQALWFLVLFLVLQQIEGNLIYPHVVGGSVGLPSIWVLVAVTVGGNMFGIMGILLFIPLCSVLYTLFRDVVKKRLKEKKIPEKKWRS